MTIRFETKREARSEPEPSIGLLRRQALARLREAGIESAEADARVLLAYALGVEGAALRADANMKAPNEARLRFEGFVARRLAGEPVARIIGVKEFWSRPFRLGPDTLVPRPETETLVEAALAAFPDRNAAFSVLDFGTGAGGLLAAVLAERPRAFGVGVDCSEGALAITRANLAALGLGGRAMFACGNWGAALKGTFDLVVCNPPYIASYELARLAREVREHDPKLALDGGTDGLDAYRAIVRDLPRVLSAEGVAVLELGEGQESDVTNLAQAAGLAAAGPARRDLAGIPRALMLRKRP
ncbi:MAG TPA: peptide chain release factor N(5)-glutamine methyltransferase [Xanthobacteraceae bacterium]|nr:peptide chain release factor N(5)-glutamine methyltransferase [Xanthobacteraceae bacterium]